MSQEKDDQEELHSLLGGLCNGSLSETEHACLQAILKADSSAREEYLDYIDVHLDLKRITAQAGDLPLDSDRVLKAILEDPLGSHRILASQCENSNLQPRPTRSRTKSWWALLATVAAAILILANPYWFSRPAHEESGGSPPIGAAKTNSRVRLTQAASAKFFGETNPALQSIVPFGHEYALSEGAIELLFPAGATAIIESPAIFEIFDDTRLMMKTGVCSVHAPDGAQGFRVDTPMANVVDLGTRFVLSVSQSGETKVQVIEGEADVFTMPIATNMKAVAVAPIKLREHQARFIESEDRANAKEVPFKASDYRSTLPDRLTGFEATEVEGGAVDELVAISVQRNAVDFTYNIDQLIGVDLIHFRGAGNAFMVTPLKIDEPSSPEPNQPSRARFIEHDRSLCSGLINPGGQTIALDSDPILDNSALPNAIGTPGIGFRFQIPITNAAGPDVVVFELQTIVNSEKGDAFHVSPLHFEAGLHSYTVRRYDIDLTSPQSRYLAPFRLYRSVEDPKSLRDVLTTVHRGGVQHTIRAKTIAVGIDLSDLGYANGAQCAGLFLQDAADDSDFFDPVFIAGLPTTEP